MGIFDDGSQQTIVDTARQQIDKPLAVFVEVFSAALQGNKDPIIAAPRRVLTRDTPQRYKLRLMLARKRLSSAKHC